MTTDNSSRRDDAGAQPDAFRSGRVGRSTVRTRRGRGLIPAGARGWEWPAATPVCDWIPGASPAGLIHGGTTGRVAAMALAGEVDLDNRAAAEFRLLQLCAELGEGDVVLLDLHDLTFMDVAGSEVIASLGRELRSRGALLVVRGARPTVRLVLQITRQLDSTDDVVAEVPVRDT